jgi:peptidoglycan glycosyltransferase
VNIGTNINITKLKNTCSDLLFQKKLPVKIEYNKSTFSLSEKDSDFLKAQTVFGQGETLISPIHAAILVQAIANGGVAMEPSFVSKITDARGNTVKTYQAKTYKTLFEPEMAEKLKSYMRGVVTYGTATRLNNFENLTVYGKTGSAEIDSARNINSWFIGFAENENTGASYTVVVVAENVAEGTSPAPAVSITNQILKVLD